MYYYAQTNEFGKVYTVCELTGKMDDTSIIPIKSYDTSLLGKYYDQASKRFEEITISTNKTTITADGVDTAMVTAQIPAVLLEITFYHADTGEPMATVPVDSETHTATLQVTATTPGTIRIRAGEPTMTKLNEVVITAQ